MAIIVRSIILILHLHFLSIPVKLKRKFQKILTDKKTKLSMRNLALASLPLVIAISACSLPPKEALHQIQKDGLIAFLSGDMTETKPQLTPARPTPPPSSITTPARQTPATSPGSLIGPPVIASQPPVRSSVNLAPASGDRDLAAMAVPSLPGFVRSPYTNPPRLVDVKGASPGATMICPYTQRAFTIPQDYVAPVTPTANVASNNPPPSNGGGLTVKPNTLITQSNPPATTPPSSPSANVFSGSSAPKNDSAPTKPSAQSPSTAANTTPAPAPKPIVAEIPYGSPLPGRPGFVNSPFAQKHQLVDVTGLPTGMEVKCPYTGKLFRVPAQDVAEQKNQAAPSAPPAPEKK